MNEQFEQLVEFVHIRYERLEEHVCRITLDRPERLNAYTPALCAELRAALSDYHERDDLRVAIMTGSGRSFCVGGDVRGDDPGFVAMRTKQLGRGRDLAENMHAVVRQLHEMDKPVLAQVNGLAVAGGLTLALFCDYRVAAESARLGDTSGKVGLLPDEGGAWAFPRAMGYDRALMMTWRAELYPARRALELGLVSEVVADEELAEHTLGIARDLATRAPIAIRVAKTLMRMAVGSSLESSLADAALAVEYVNRTTDATEGMTAFREKRPPRFKGN